MTNNHVVEDTGKIHVTLHDGQKYPATVIGLDPKTDLAVIKIKSQNLPYLSFGNSDHLKVGDWAIAIGNPFGLQATVTVGVISAIRCSKRRRHHLPSEKNRFRKEVFLGMQTLS
ncbi:protease, Do family [Chlamydia pneumoniae LPCoLN]|nr:protease, Do family [Chlamydia pneumoniae LPCoLN]